LKTPVNAGDWEKNLTLEIYVYSYISCHVTVGKGCFEVLHHSAIFVRLFPYLLNDESGSSDFLF